MSASSECGCSAFGACDSVGNCECQDGYSGSTCSYTDSEFLSFTAQISHEISNLEASVGSVREIMTNLAILTRSPEVVTIDSANTAMQILDTIVNQGN